MISRGCKLSVLAMECEILFQNVTTGQRSTVVSYSWKLSIMLDRG